MELPPNERPDAVIYDLGMMTMKGFQHEEHIYAVYPQKLSDRHRIRNSSVPSDAPVTRMTSQLSSLNVSFDSTSDDALSDK